MPIIQRLQPGVRRVAGVGPSSGLSVRSRVIESAEPGASISPHCSEGSDAPFLSFLREVSRDGLYGQPGSIRSGPRTGNVS